MIILSENESKKKSIEFILEWDTGSNWDISSKDELLVIGDIYTNKKRVLDLGCGLGRTSIYMNNIYNMKETKFYLCDYFCETPEDQIKSYNYPFGGFGYHIQNESYPVSNINLLKELCDLNSINYEIIDMNDVDKIHNLRDIDLVTSFHAIGYHFPIKENIEKFKLNDITSKKALFMFGVNRQIDECLGYIKERDGPRQEDIDIGLQLKEKRFGKQHQNFLIYGKKI